MNQACCTSSWRSKYNCESNCSGDSTSGHYTLPKLNPNAVNSWIDRSGNFARWSDKVLARDKRGNNSGHSNGGRKGIFVRKLMAMVLRDSHVG